MLVSFASSIIKNIVVIPALSKFPLKLICWFAFWSASNAYYLLKSIAINYNVLWNKDNLVNNQLCNHQHKQLQFFLMVSYILNFYWLMVHVISFVQELQHFNLLFLQLEEYFVQLVRATLFSNDKAKILFIPWKFGLTGKSKYWFFASVYTFDWYVVLLIVLLKPNFNSCNSFTLSWIEKVTTET